MEGDPVIMFKRFPRQLLTRAGSGAAIIALVAVTGYGLGQTQAARSIASAAPASTSAPPRAGTVAAPAVTTSYAPVVSAAAPAVVTVRVEGRARMVPTQMPDDPLFREFFGRRFQIPQTPRRLSGLGSGVIATTDGYILTNNHVVEGSDRVTVELTDRRTLPAKVVGTDPATDLALLKVDATNLPTLPIGDSSRVNVGDVVLAIGNPLNVGQTVTMGIISAKGRATGLGDGSYEDFLQTDAPINQGNSGGALVSATGELVGINSQILTPSGGNIGLGFAIPSNMARQVMDQLKSDGKVVRGRLGVRIQNITSDMASSLKLADVSGAIVSSVEPGGPAEHAGVKQGDVIVAINGEKVADSNALKNRIASARPGTKIDVDVVRDGRKQTLQATVDTLDSKDVRRTSLGTGSEEGGGFGMTVEPLTREDARNLGLKRSEGVIIRDVDPDGAAGAAGLRADDVIVQVDGQVVKTPTELKSALTRAGGRPALLLVARENTEIFVTLKQK
jgi:Do/DeqQ family serine protease